MIEVKCPKCGSTDFECYDIDCNMEHTIHWDECYCNVCDEQFDIRYEAVEIETRD